MGVGVRMGGQMHLGKNYSEGGAWRGGGGSVWGRRGYGEEEGACGEAGNVCMWMCGEDVTDNNNNNSINDDNMIKLHNKDIYKEKECQAYKIRMKKENKEDEEMRRRRNREKEKK